ncbi:MAG: PfkB family carbohydrate kinase [Anaerolineales bacterium]|nr:PfkB family carbohydrate kinase [Anaerolineales bacterium]
MKINKMYDLICIGNYTKDTIVTPTGVTYVDGGAVNYSAHAAVRLGLNVAAVTHLAREDDRVVEKFKRAGIDCLPTFTPHSTCMRLEYPTTNPDFRTLSVTHTAGSITAEEIQGLQSKSAVIGPSLRGEVGLDVILALKKKDIQVGIDVQGYVRVIRDQNLVYEPWEEMSMYLEQIDVLKSDAVEAEYLTGEADIYKAASAFLEMGPKEIVLTHKDGVLVYGDGIFYDRRFFPKNMDGRSGRGDTCVGSYMSMRLSKSPEEASIWAAAVTSLKMENQGPFNRTLADVEDLISEKYSGQVH